MAAAIGDKRAWMVTQPGYETGKTYPIYISSLSCNQIFNRTAAVAATAGVGAGIGAGVGAIVTTPSIVGIPAGAASGAFIGGMTGLGVGIAGTMIFDVCKYVKACKDLKQDGARAFTRKLANMDLDPAYLCGITHMPIIEPVVIRGEPQMYERKDLLRWISSSGTSPMTRKRITERDIDFTPTGLAYNGKVCHEILSDPVAVAKFTPAEVVALKAYREDCVAVSGRFYKKETAQILKDANSLAVNPRDSLAKLTALVNLIDPIANLNFDEIEEVEEVEEVDGPEQEEVEENAALVPSFENEGPEEWDIEGDELPVLPYDPEFPDYDHVVQNFYSNVQDEQKE